jgi:hypothetical protein
MKKKWAKPEIVVLFRVNSNEVVLGNCKMQYGNGPEIARTGCMNVTGGGACRGAERHGS